MRIAVIGSTGQLGTDLLKQLDGDVVPLSHHDIELGSDESVTSCLTAVAPDVVINTAAYNFVDQAEDEPQVAYEINALGPRRLAQFCAARSITLVHYSSDYVFGLSPGQESSWCETDAPGPENAYAASKLQGEYFVRSLCPKHFVIRTCGLYGTAALQGAGKGNFVETMIRLGTERDALNVVNDQRCTPTSTVDLALATMALIQTTEFGLYHVTNSGATTWFELAGEIFRRQNLNVQLSPITTAEFGAKAKRPACSVLDCRRYESVTGQELPHWHDALQRYLDSRL